MESNNNTLTELKFKVHSATKQKLKLEHVVSDLRSKEQILAEQLTCLNAEKDSLLLQIRDISDEITKFKSHLAIVNICSESERAKIEVSLSNMDKHTSGYDALFDKERTLYVQQNEQVKQKENEIREIERRKIEHFHEKNKKQAMQAALLDEESIALEKECVVLTKRNKAIMLQLRRKLMDSEDKRRELMKKVAQNVK